MTSTGGGRKVYLGAELIKFIDPNEGEALRRGGLVVSLPEPGGGAGAPCPPPLCSAAYGEEYRGQISIREDKADSP